MDSGKDTGIRLEGDAVQSLTVTFLEMWNAVSDKAANDSDFSNTFSTMIMRHSKLGLFNLMQTALWIMNK